MSAVMTGPFTSSGTPLTARPRAVALHRSAWQSELLTEGDGLLVLTLSFLEIRQRYEERHTIRIWGN